MGKGRPEGGGGGGAPTNSGTGEKGGFGWKGYAAAGLGIGGLLGMLFSDDELDKADFNFDPEFVAKKRSAEMFDLNSTFNRQTHQMYRELAADASPTTDSLLAAFKASGISGSSASSLALSQGKANSARAREASSKAFMQQYFQNQSIGAQYLGLEYQRGATEINAWNEANKNQGGGLGEELFKLGGGLLSLVV